MRIDHYIVEGLNSENLRDNIQKELESIESVKGVYIDLGRGCVEVIYNDLDVSEEIRDCIERTGHPIN